MRILLVEDDEMIGEGVVDGLKAEGYAVDWVQDGNSALIALRTTPFSLVILDLGLPGKDGISVLQEVRSQRMHVPVLVTTARDTVSDRVKGLDAGADDYLVSPLTLTSSQPASVPFCAAPPAAASPRLSGRTRHQAGNPRSLFPRRAGTALLQGVCPSCGACRPSGRCALARPARRKLYNWDSTVGSNAIEVHVHHLRKKLSDGAIKTVRGVGYLLET